MQKKDTVRIRKRAANVGQPKEARLSIAVEYVGIIAVACLFAGALIGASIGFRQGARSIKPTEARTETSPQAGLETMLAQIERETDADKLIEIGNQAYDHNLPKIAIPAYEKALVYRPNNPDVLTDLGIMCLRGQQTERAIELFRRAAATDDKHAGSRYNLGVALRQVGDREGARKAFQEALRLQPDGEFGRLADKQLTELGK